MESGLAKWRFQGNEELKNAAAVTVRGLLYTLSHNLNQHDQRVTIPLGHGDPSSFSCFRTSIVAEDSVVDVLRSAKYNFYPPTAGLLQARRAVADYLSRDIPPHKISPDDVYLTVGCNQAIETILAVLARPGANILLPRPGFPSYEARAASSHLEIHHFDLLPEKGWEVNLDSVEALADQNTVAMVIINPGNPCGNVYSYKHLQKIAETAKKLGILLVADEVYDHLTFGSNPFVPMASFQSITPIVTLGSISKRWCVPGWRFGWLVVNDPEGVLQATGITKCITSYLDISSNPTTFIQAAIPQILEKTKEDFFSKTINILREAADLCYERIKEIPCITCPNKPEGSMFVMVKLDISLLEGISDDFDFCLKLAREESVIVLPGKAVGMENWLRITFGIDIAALEDGLGRINAFCQRHAKK